ncbi:pH-response regulator protein palH/rim21 [Cladophialophora chaetospira]|uniref:PH-response regulator protein palH/rim21 n=1 Tax=Cladophialophora chaetospira TaxID=386627 RepID=A0AA38WZU9_9EURO|nr:pH-response regulator protein palH/rim21 [Cladophialophora chaetospira]
MSNDASITARQLWGQLSTPAATDAARDAWCTPLILPSGGIFIFADDTTTTLRARVTFKLPCENPDPIISPDTTGNSSVVGFSNPFYASISPQIFALATATVISYILVILIFITPRTFYLGGAGGGGRFLGRRGIITGSYGSSAVVGVGRRPLLQKIATVTVAISLTIATADTFNVAEDQYNQGYIDSSQLVDNVVRSLEIRIIRVISDTFLWLAQVQTLIRLFPRHKEKVTIKWLGFAMVSFDTIFSILDSFVKGGPRTHPRSFSDAIPALNYLFELAISLIYASCVVYYCLSKRRFAFWHPKMKNICLVALLSLISVVIPVVFFILDISQPDLAGWGEYIRWVGAAAASVVVWEWVERIESLERDERKDGILGREIFDGDEMLNMTPSEDANWRGDLGSDQNGGAHKGIGDGVVSKYRRLRARLPLRKRRKRTPPDGIATGSDALDATGQPISDSQFVVPQQVLTPPNRSDTGSATSTVYAVRYHNLTSPSPNPQPELQPGPDSHVTAEAPKQSDDSTSSPTDAEKELALQDAARATTGPQGRNLWQAVQNPFKRKRSEPPAEVVDAQNASGIRRSPIDRTLNLRDRLGAFASAQKDRFGSRGTTAAAALPVTVIPAPKSNDRTWSPDDGPIDEEAVRVTNMEPQRPGEESVDGNHVSGQVVFIPAPTSGRTWSPDDAQLHASPSPVLPRPDAAVLRQPLSSPGPLNSHHQTYTPRGSLVISESDPRPSRVIDAAYPASPRSATYARPPAVAPIAEDVSNEAGGDVGTQPGAAPATNLSPAASPADPGGEHSTSRTPTISPPTESAAPESQGAGQGSPRVSNSDGRDMGGGSAPP